MDSTYARVLNNWSLNSKTQVTMAPERVCEKPATQRPVLLACC